MTLSYDVSLMQQLVAACQTANDEIIKAQQQIQAVKSHGDWTCKEKSVIDELMEDCKNLINRMQEDQNGFLNVLKQVEGELDGAEKSISSLFQGVESILGKILSIPTAVTTVVGGGLIGAASGVVGAIDNGIGGTIGTGGWIQSGIDWVAGIGAEIADNEIWHGPGPIGVSGIWDQITVGAESGIDIITGGWQEVIGTGINPTGVVGEVISDVWENGIGGSGSPIIPDTIQDIIGHSPVGGVINEVWDNVTDVFEGVGEEMGHWADTVINTPIPICRMGDIQL